MPFKQSPRSYSPELLGENQGGDRAFGGIQVYLGVPEC
jgi:hypothetical protein